MTTSATPLVSVVTPVYNGATHLSECLDSLLAQTHRAWECTVVDNCSTDGTAEIARRYAAKDSRIVLRQNQQFLSALSNYNLALRGISLASKYCKVVFADDWIFPECLEKMVAVAEQHPSVGLVSSYCLKDRKVTNDGLPYSSTVVRGPQVCRAHLLSGLYLFGSANCVLYRADLVRGREPFYDEHNVHSDTEVCFALLRTCDFGFVHQILTYSRVQAGSQRTVSEELGSDFGGMLRVLMTHGRHFLSETEFDTRLEQHLADYYRFLSRRIFTRADRRFWEFHTGQLNAVRPGFSRIRLARATLATVLDGALSPRESIDTILRYARPRTRRPDCGVDALRGSR